MKLAKKILKTFNKLYFFKEPILHKNSARSFDYVFYLKEPISHLLCKEILSSGIENYLIIIDDQFGYRSDSDFYQSFIRVKSKFTCHNFLKIFRNEFILLEEVIKTNVEVFQNANFIPVYDRSQEMEYIIPKYRHVFKSIITIQHGCLGGPDGYFPFLSDIFIARSHNDAQIGMQYELNENQYIIVAGNLLAPHITSDKLKYNIQKKHPVKNVLYAARYGLKFNIKFLMSAICTAKTSSPVYYKAHPSDRMKCLYSFIVYMARIFGKKIFMTNSISQRHYKFLVTESSSLIFELLREGALPVIINPNKIKLPYYVEPWLFHSKKKCIDVKEAKKHYQDKVDKLKNYYFDYDYQSNAYTDTPMLYRKLLEDIHKNGTSNFKAGVINEYP